MLFRINVAIVVRTDFSSVFINQTSLSFEFKRLKLGQLLLSPQVGDFGHFQVYYSETETDIRLQFPQRSNAHILYLVGDYPGIYQSQFSCLHVSTLYKIIISI